MLSTFLCILTFIGFWIIYLVLFLGAYASKIERFHYGYYGSLLAVIVTSEEQNANGSLPKLSKDVNVAVVNAVHPLPIPLLNALLPKV